MALWDEVKLEYSSTHLIQITNPDTEAATTVNDTQGTRAATRAENIFRQIVGVTYDNSNEQHKTVAIPLVEWILKQRAGRLDPVMEQERAFIYEDLRGLAKVTARDRVTPDTDSVLEATSEDVEGQVDRPNFDSQRFDDITPDSPAAP
jgi:hypothetical protein